MAQELYNGIKDIPGVQVAQPQANALFPILPAASIEPLQNVAKFYVWDHMINQVRWMCSWDTTQADVDNFVAAVKSELTN
jgi:threonine aldolase